MSTTAWKGHLNFGLLSIPVKLYVSARDERVSLNQLHKPCGSRIKMPQTCPVCNRPVAKDEVVKGYEFAKDQYVTLTEDELKAITPISDHVMEIVETISLAEVDPLYFGDSWFCVPEPAGAKPYCLLARALRDAKKCALAHLTKNQREMVCVIRPKAKGLVIHAMYYANEVRQVAEFDTLAEKELTPAEVKLALKLVESMSNGFQPEQYKDGYQARLQELVEAKQKGETVTATPAPAQAPVLDTLAALEASLEAARKKGRKHAA